MNPPLAEDAGTGANVVERVSPEKLIAKRTNDVPLLRRTVNVPLTVGPELETVALKSSYAIVVPDDTVDELSNVMLVPFAFPVVFVATPPKLIFAPTAVLFWVNVRTSVSLRVLAQRLDSPGGSVEHACDRALPRHVPANDGLGVSVKFSVAVPLTKRP